MIRAKYAKITQVKALISPLEQGILRNYAEDKYIGKAIYGTYSFPWDIFISYMQESFKSCRSNNGQATISALGLIK